MNTSSQATAAFGSALSVAPYNATAGTLGTYVHVAQTQDLTSPNPEAGDIKITNNDSPNGGNPAGSQEYIPGMTEPGDVEFDVVYAKALHQAQLYAAANNGLIYGWKETFPDTPATVCTFLGYIKAATITGKTENGALMGKVKIKLAGPVVWA